MIEIKEAKEASSKDESFKEIFDKKIDLEYGTEDTTEHGMVRTQNYTVGVGYKMDKSSSVGLEAQKELHDSSDATSWNRDVAINESISIKYKKKF